MTFNDCSRWMACSVSPSTVVDYCMLSLLGMLIVAGVIVRYWPPLATIRLRELELSTTTMGYGVSFCIFNFAPT